MGCAGSCANDRHAEEAVTLSLWGGKGKGGFLGLLMANHSFKDEYYLPGQSVEWRKGHGEWRLSCSPLGCLGQGWGQTDAGGSSWRTQQDLGVSEDEVEEADRDPHENNPACRAETWSFWGRHLKGRDPDRLHFKQAALGAGNGAAVSSGGWEAIHCQCRGGDGPK